MAGAKRMNPTSMMFESGTTAAWYTFDFWTAGRYRTNATTTMTTRAVPTAKAWSLLEDSMMLPYVAAVPSVVVDVDRLGRGHRSLSIGQSKPTSRSEGSRMGSSPASRSRAWDRD
jgi:hypothetical protein